MVSETKSITEGGRMSFGKREEEEEGRRKE